MSKNKEMVGLSLITVMMFFLSFLFLFNDSMNYFIVFMTITIVLFVYFCYVVFSKKDEKSLYKKQLRKILKTYDSILVYSDCDYKIENKNIIFLKRFEDLLVAQEELDIPIVYIEEKESSVFLIKNDKELLTYILRENDNIESPFEYKLKKEIENEKEIENSNNKKILDDLDKTTIIQLKNNKVYKVSPLKK